MFDRQARFYLGCAVVLAVLMLFSNLQRAYPMLRDLAVKAYEAR